MKTLIISTLVAGGILASGGLLRAEHDKACKNVHGKVTAVTENGITVNDKLYKVGNTTRILKEEKVVKIEKLSAGDLVCLDTRGNDDIGEGEIASVAVLGLSEPSAVREKEVVREKEIISQPGTNPSREVIREKEKEKIREEN